MLAENKLSKYIGYAIGEIILVVIGILIALQINTANQNRQRIKLENVLLQQVKLELLEIYDDLWFDSSILSIGEKSHANINKYIVQNSPYTDSMCFDFYWIKYDEYIYPTNAAYSRLKKEGLDIISNPTIHFYLQELYESHFPRLSKKDAFTPDIPAVFNDYYLDHFKPNIDSSIKFSWTLVSDTIGSRIYSVEPINFPQIDNNDGQRTIGFVPLNFLALKKDSKFLMLLAQTKRYRDYKIRRYTSAKNRVKEVLDLIDQALEQD